MFKEPSTLLTNTLVSHLNIVLVVSSAKKNIMVFLIHKGRGSNGIPHQKSYKVEKGKRKGKERKGKERKGKKGKERKGRQR